MTFCEEKWYNNFIRKGVAGDFFATNGVNTEKSRLCMKQQDFGCLISRSLLLFLGGFFNAYSDYFIVGWLCPAH